MKPAMAIGTHQIEQLVLTSELDVSKSKLIRVLNFRMPSLELVMKHYESEKGRFESDYCPLEKRDVQATYYYYNGHVIALQTRAIRYLAMYYALEQLIELKNNESVLRDLKEIGVDLDDEKSVKDAKARIQPPLKCVLNSFEDYADQAYILDNYLKVVVDEYWKMCCSDEERFGSDKLCLVNWAERLGVFNLGIYIEPTKKQVEEEEEESQKRIEKLSKHMAKIFDKTFCL